MDEPAIIPWPTEPGFTDPLTSHLALERARWIVSSREDYRTIIASWKRLSKKHTHPRPKPPRPK